jgi:molecular chaperone GrpE (heat shock protein)
MELAGSRLERRPHSVSTDRTSPDSSGGDQAELLDAIEQDTRRLIREIADAKHRLAETERSNTIHSRKMLLALIEIQDGFDQVFRSIQAKENQITPQMKTWIGNFRTVRRLLDRVLADEGVATIQRSASQTFDPHWHSVAELVNDSTKGDATILEETKRGYTWHGELLRRMEVVVVQNA